MCLSKIIESYDNPSALITDGRKQFSGTNLKPEFQSYSIHGKKSVPFDEWIKADTSQQIKASDGNDYEAGFHVYEEDTKETNTAPYRRVFVRYVTARGDEGYSSNRKVLIAREMFVPSDQNGWPPKPGDPPTPKKQSTLDKIRGAMKPGQA
jgi:hypothetical protein